MLYARRSLNYWLAIGLIRRAGLLMLYALGINPGGVYDQHLKNAHTRGLWRYLKIRNFVHHNTDGPLNPYSKVYDLPTVRADFPDFTIMQWHQEFMHAPPLPVSRLPLARALGWHLWVHMKRK